MVKTSTGPVDGPEDLTSHPEERADRDRDMQAAIQIDDEVWDRVVALARSQSSSPSAVVKRAIDAMFGRPSPVGAVNSGSMMDPRLGTTEPEIAVPTKEVREPDPVEERPKTAKPPRARKARASKTAKSK